ncbi:MAG: alpha/beta hydrolase [Halioglobus sp.]|nr:alpha/beta hydrolase [Halioglobus sp.]
MKTLIKQGHKLHIQCCGSRWSCRVMAALGLLLGSACAPFGGPAHERLLESAGWTSSQLEVAGFQLALFSQALPVDTELLNIYLGGDGSAFVARQRIGRDPTGSEHTGLQLAIADPAPSAFLARPCYYGGAFTPPCEPSLWTLERYSPRVVGAVVEALAELARRYPRARLTLVGYSGGGVIALLAARQLERVERVITVAAPLDTAAWTQHHGYTNLSAGSNPAQITDWPVRLRQLHLFGDRDTRVPATVVASYHAATGLSPAQSVTVPVADYDHACCWVQDWPAILAALAAR